MKRVVLLGTSRRVMVPLLAAGHRVTALYEPWEASRVAPLRDQLVRSCAVDSHLSVESLMSALHHVGALAERIDAVVSTGELGVVSAAILGRWLGARALDPDAALRCRDKAVQKAAWRRAGVPTAPFVVIPDAIFDDIAAATRAAGVRSPFVVKPIAGYGTRSVAIANDEAELVALVGRVAGQDPAMRRLLIEHRVDGDEWHFDGVVRAGVLHTLHVARYVRPLIETKRGQQVASIAPSPRANPVLHDAAGAFTRGALGALGLDTAVFHFEVFAAPGSLDFVAGELAARPAGNFIGDYVKRGIGVDLWAAATQLFTGDEIARVQGHDDCVRGATDLPASSGRPNRVREDDVLAIPGVVEVALHVAPGARMRDMRESSAINIGHALVEGRSEEACAATIARVADLVRQINEATI